jgi:proteasome lid subunit RPN8/RPN11
MLMIPKSIFNELIAHARQGLPLEVCGILGGNGDRVTAMNPMANADASSEHFTLEPQEQFAVHKALRAKGLSILAIYHSHPATPARPSPEDIRMAYTPGVSHVIISLADTTGADVKSFQIVNGTVEQERLEIVSDGESKI